MDWNNFQKDYSFLEKERREKGEGRKRRGEKRERRERGGQQKRRGSSPPVRRPGLRPGPEAQARSGRPAGSGGMHVGWGKGRVRVGAGGAGGRWGWGKGCGVWGTGHRVGITVQCVGWCVEVGVGVGQQRGAGGRQ